MVLDFNVEGHRVLFRECIRVEKEGIGGLGNKCGYFGIMNVYTHAPGGSPSEPQQHRFDRNPI